MARYKISKTKNSRAYSFHRTLKTAEKAREKIGQPGRYNYSIFKWNAKIQKWE